MKRTALILIFVGCLAGCGGESEPASGEAAKKVALAATAYCGPQIDLVRDQLEGMKEVSDDAVSKAAAGLTPVATQVAALKPFATTATQIEDLRVLAGYLDRAAGATTLRELDDSMKAAHDRAEQMGARCLNPITNEIRGAGDRAKAARAKQQARENRISDMTDEGCHAPEGGTLASLRVALIDTDVELVDDAWSEVTKSGRGWLAVRFTIGTVDVGTTLLISYPIKNGIAQEMRAENGTARTHTPFPESSKPSWPAAGTEALDCVADNE